MYENLKGLLKAYHQMNFVTQVITGAFFLYASYVVAEYMFGTFGLFMKILACMIAPVILFCLGALPFLQRIEWLWNAVSSGVNWMIMGIPTILEWLKDVAKEANEEAKAEAEAKSKAEPESVPA